MTGVFTFLLVIAAVVSTFHQCSSHRLTKENWVPTTTRSAENTVKTCLPHKYLNVFTQNCIDFDEHSDDEDQGDCPNKMHLTLNPGTKTVTCVCNFESAEVPLIYVQQKKQCYELFRKGPCRAGKVILIENGTRPGCFDNPCPDMNYDEDDNLIVVFNGTCSRLNGPCTGRNRLDGDIMFFRQSLICYTVSSDDHSIPAPARICESEQMFDGECLKPFEWSVDDYTE